jgi:hypothetical protein
MQVFLEIPHPCCFFVGSLPVALAVALALRYASVDMVGGERSRKEGKRRLELKETQV